MVERDQGVSGSVLVTGLVVAWACDEPVPVIAASRRLRLGLDFGALVRPWIGLKKLGVKEPSRSISVGPHTQSQAPIAVVVASHR